MIISHNSKNITRMLAVTVNCEICIVNCNIYEWKSLYFSKKQKAV
ncbi:conserved protein of unknown function [Clostridium beijerinckii]|nr:conserved protein of unknown function [Clostridium beijerinckii]